MDLIIIMLALVALLVWTVVGIMTIGYFVYYHKMMKPIMEPMTKFYKKMLNEMNEEL